MFGVRKTKDALDLKKTVKNGGGCIVLPSLLAERGAGDNIF